MDYRGKKRRGEHVKCGDVGGKTQITVQPGIRFPPEENDITESSED